MLQTLKNAWKTPELRTKILFTIMVLLLYRLGATIPVPFVNSDAISSAVGNMGGLVEYMSMLSGPAFSSGALFALNVSPYITASIVIQLLTIAIPALERLSKQGEEGRKKINMITRYLTLGLAVVTAIGYVTMLSQSGVLAYNAKTPTWFVWVVMIVCLCAGSSIIMWLAEKINEKGIGNGISMILFANIISRLPLLVQGLWNNLFDDLTGKFTWVGLILSILSLLLTLAIVFIVVWFTESERRIPIQYAKRQVGRKMYGGQSSNLPLKMNMAGVMPVIFASSIIAIPATIAMFFQGSAYEKFVLRWFTGIQGVVQTSVDKVTIQPEGATWYGAVIYMVLTILLIFAFSYFYIMISFNPVEVANNIKNQGGSIPGIRPGRPTSDYITKILRRITTLGAVFLAFIAGFPMLVSIVSAVCGRNFPGLSFGGTSLLIVVGVALETFRSLESQLAMRNYKGFLD